jgi:hypothetical protein
MDYIDQKFDEKNGSDVEEVGADDECCDTDNEENNDRNPMDRDDVFVPPLQAKIEMMKKLSGVPLKNETLKQSQEQGGPAGGGNPQSNELKAQLTMSEMFDDGPMDE